jgi:tetratricopeptide (TPR) repeat protein
VSLDDAVRALEAAEAETRRRALDRIAAEGDARLTEPVAARLHDDDDEVAARAEAVLWQIWSRPPDATTGRAFEDGMRRMQAEDWLGAVTAFTACVAQAPGFAEGWNKRATARYLAEHYALALEDCAEVVRLNPHHFGALSGQGLCHAALGQTAQAAACFRRALQVHPRLPGIRARLQTIEMERVRGNGH